MNRYKQVVAVSAVACGLLAAGTTASAQAIAKGQTEVVGFAGAVSDGGGATFGGGVQHALSPRLFVAGEVGYLTGGNDVEGFGVSVDSHAISIDVNARYLFPISGNEKFSPYVLGGLGYLRAAASVSASGISASASDSAIGLNLGGGVRWQAGPRWGVQPELKIFIADGSNVRLSASVYYGFGK